MNWLQKVVSTTLVVVTGCVLAILDVLFYFIATLLKVELDPLTFGSVLTFTGAAMGIGYKQFKAKRETAWAEDDEGIAYKPGTRVVREVHPSEKYNAGIKNRADFSDVNVVEQTKLSPPRVDEEPESVEERENAGIVPAPVPEEDFEPIEGDD